MHLKLMPNCRTSHSSVQKSQSSHNKILTWEFDILFLAVMVTINKCAPLSKQFFATKITENPTHHGSKSAISAFFYPLGILLTTNARKSVKFCWDVSQKVEERALHIQLPVCGGHVWSRSDTWWRIATSREAALIFYLNTSRDVSDCHCCLPREKVEDQKGQKITLKGAC